MVKRSPKWLHLTRASADPRPILDRASTGADEAPCCRRSRQPAGSAKGGAEWPSMSKKGARNVKLRLVAFACGAAGVALMTLSPSVAYASSVALPHDFFAVANANGTLARGTPGTTIDHPGPGLYNVVFPGSVAGCAANANLGYGGESEQFTFTAAVTVSLSRTEALVDVTYPGNTTAGFYPHNPVLEDNSFHLHVDCSHALFANVAANGTLQSSSPEVTAGSHVTGSGQYELNFGRDISECSPVATVSNANARKAFAAQAYLALGADGQSLRVSVNKSSTKAVDWSFHLIVTCGEEPNGFGTASYGYAALSVAQAPLCAFTGGVYDYSAGSAPTDQGYVATWANSTTTGLIQVKNGGYGIAPGRVDLVATC